MERVVVDADDIAEIEAFADLADIRLAIERNWPAIPVEQQTAIRDRILLGLDYCEIAEKHGVTEPTVRSRVSRGLHSLRETIEAERTANSEGPA